MAFSNLLLLPPARERRHPLEVMTGHISKTNAADKSHDGSMGLVYLGVSKNTGTPKSSILIGFSIINHPFWGTSIFGNTHMKTIHLERHMDPGKKYTNPMEHLGLKRGEQTK